MAVGGLILAAVAAIALAYQLVAILACFAFLAKRGSGGTAAPVSILKSVGGLDPRLRDAIASHMKLEGEFELLAGVRDPQGPAAQVLREFPSVSVIPVETQAPNGKAGTLAELVRLARHEVIVVSDADIEVAPDYLRRVTAPLSDPRIGLVTCLYRTEGDTFPARFEGLGVSTDFAPSTLVARLVGVKEFAMGSTLAFRRRDLDRIGGFLPIAEYLADDYQLGRRIHALGLECVLSDVIVGTHMGGTWTEVWRHQVRWARTIRVSKFWGYLGLPVTFATVWGLAAIPAGFAPLGLAALAARLLMGALAGGLALRSRDAITLLPLLPFRDVFGAAVWLVGLFGRTVVWRGQILELLPGGRIRPV